MTKGEETRNRIIARAAPLFNRRGYAGCSLHDVMQATGLRKGGLYRHFASKEELAAEALRYSLARSIKTRTDGLEHVPGALDRLRAAIQRFVESPSPIEGGCPLVNSAVDADDTNPALRRIAARAFEEWRGRVEALLDEAIARGELRPDCACRTLANTIIATLEGSLILARITRDPQPLRDAQSSLERLILDAAMMPREEPAGAQGRGVAR